MLNIRKATDADAATVASVIARSFQRQAELLAINRSDCPSYVAFETEAGVRRRIASGADVALAYEGNEVIGTITSSFREGAPALAEILRLAVLPAHRGKNYGNELMTYAEQRLIAAGAQVLELSVVAQFERLRCYYEGLGYVVKELKRVPSLPFELLFMEKKVGDSASAFVRR